MSRLQKIFLLAATAFLGSCSFFGNKPLTEEQIAELGVQERELIVATISDDEREGAFLALLDEREDLIQSQIGLLRKHAAALRELNADYRSEREQYSARFAAYNLERVAIQRDFVRLIARMKELSTTQEWEVIVDYQLQYMKARVLTFQRAFRGA